MSHIASGATVGDVFERLAGARNWLVLGPSFGPVGQVVLTARWRFSTTGTLPCRRRVWPSRQGRGVSCGLQACMTSRFLPQIKLKGGFDSWQIAMVVRE